MTKISNWNGEGRPPANAAFVDLDDAQLDRLVRRLQRVRGGKNARRSKPVDS